MPRTSPNAVARGNAAAATALGPEALAGVSRALGLCHDEANAALFDRALAPVVFQLEWPRWGGALRFRPAAWRRGRLVRGEMVVSIGALRRPAALARAVLHGMLHEYAAVLGIRKAVACGRYHPLAFARAAERVGCRVPPRDESEGFAAVRVPRRWGGISRTLSARIAAAVAVEGIPPEPRGGGRNLNAFECRCEPPRTARLWDDVADVLCKRCRRDFRPAVG